MNLFWEAVKLVIVLSFILVAAVYVIKFVLVKLQPDYNRKKGSLNVIDRLPLSQRSGLYLVQAGEKYYLLGVSAERINMLTEVSKEEVAATQAEDEKKSFKGYLDSYINAGEVGEEDAPVWKKVGRIFKRSGRGGSDGDE